jgi:hypothetical protein
MNSSLALVKRKNDKNVHYIAMNNLTLRPYTVDTAVAPQESISRRRVISGSKLLDSAFTP